MLLYVTYIHLHYRKENHENIYNNEIRGSKRNQRLYRQFNRKDRVRMGYKGGKEEMINKRIDWILFRIGEVEDTQKKILELMKRMREEKKK